MKKQVVLILFFGSTLSVFAQQVSRKAASLDMYGKYAVQLDCVKSLDGMTEYVYDFKGENLSMTVLKYHDSDGDGESDDIVKTECTYDLNGNVIEERTFVNPSITSYVYDSRDRLVECEYKIGKDGDYFLPVVKTSYEYDENDSIVRMTLSDYSNGGYMPRTITDYTFNERGQRLSSHETWYYLNGSGTFTGSCEEIRYDDAGHLLFYQLYNKDEVYDRKEYTYDEKGRERSHTFYLPMFGGELVPSEIYQIDYDERDSVCLKTLIQGQGSSMYDIADKIERTYDSNGNVTSYMRSSKYSTDSDWYCYEYWTKEYDRQGREIRWSNIMTYIDQPHTITHEYGDKGYIVKEFGYYNVYTEYEYDNNGNLLRMEHNSRKKICEYDDMLRPTRFSVYEKLNDGERLLSETVFDYDAEDCACKKEECQYEYEGTKTVLKNRFVEKFDGKGRQIADVFTYIYDGEWRYAREEYHAYDQYDELIAHTKYEYDWDNVKRRIIDFKKLYDYDVAGSMVLNNVAGTEFKLNEYCLVDENKGIRRHDIYYYSPVCFDVSEIEGMNSDGESIYPVGYYDLSGKRLSSPCRGMMIVKMSDGSGKKVMMK